MCSILLHFFRYPHTIPGDLRTTVLYGLEQNLAEGNLD